MIALAVSLIIIPLIAGYVLEIMRGTKPYIEDLRWGKLFIDGIKLVIIQLIYAIPLLIVFLIFLARVITALTAGAGSPLALVSMAGELIVGIVIFILLYVLIVIFSAIGVVRFARTGKMSDAFSFGAIAGHIGRIGWGSYILSLIVLGFVYLVSVLGVLVYAASPVMPLIGLLIYPGLVVFSARFITLIYDKVPVTP